MLNNHPIILCPRSLGNRQYLEALLDILLFHSFQRLVQQCYQLAWILPHYLIDGFFGCFGLCFLRFTPIQSWILCVASERRSDWFSLCEPSPWQAASDWTRSHRICVNRGELHGTKAQQIQTVGKVEAGLGVIAANPLCRVNIFGAPQIGTLRVDISIGQHDQLDLVNQRRSAMNAFLHETYFPFSRRWRRNGM